MLMAVVVLPSSGCALVMPIERGPSCSVWLTSAVRRARNASLNSCGTGPDKSGLRSPLTTGTRPRKRSLSRRETSSGVFTVSSR